MKKIITIGLAILCGVMIVIIGLASALHVNQTLVNSPFEGMIQKESQQENQDEISKEDTTEEGEQEDSQEGITPMDTTMYAISWVNVRAVPDTSGEKVGSLLAGQEVKVTGLHDESGWYQIDYDGTIAYVSNEYLTEEKPDVQDNANANIGTDATANQNNDNASPAQTNTPAAAEPAPAPSEPAPAVTEPAEPAPPDPGTTDPGITDPGTTEPGTTDPT